MTESKKSDRWTALLETLGIPVPQPSTPSPPPAEAPPSGESGGLPPAATTPPPAAAPPQPPRKAKPAAKPTGTPASRSPSYWSRIAGALGLEVPPEPEQPPPPVEESAPSPAPAPPAAATPPAPPARPVSQPPRMFERRTREERGRPESAGVAGPRTEEAPASPKTPSQEGFGRRGEAPRRPTERPAERPATREPVSKEDLPRRRPAEAADLPPLEEEEIEAGEEIALEGEPAAAEEPPAREGRSRRRRRRRGRRGGEGVREEAGRPVHRRDEPVRSRYEDDIEPAGEEADLEEELEAEREAVWEPEEEEATREDRAARAEGEEERAGDEERRRRRRRRRRRGGERPAAGGRADQGEARASWESASSEEAADAEEERAEAGGEEEDDQAVGVPAHKKIPTWEDAVRILIDANMAARAHQPDRGRDRGYGRGRSGR